MAAVQVNTWDDHDIFDGWGSYPDNLQQCATFKQVFGAAKALYALFQLHTTQELKEGDGYFSTPQDDGLSWSMMLGPRLAVAAPDTRSGRSRKQIVPSALIDELCRRVRPHAVTALPVCGRRRLVVHQRGACADRRAAAERGAPCAGERGARGVPRGDGDGGLHERLAGQELDPRQDRCAAMCCVPSMVSFYTI